MSVSLRFPESSYRSLVVVTSQHSDEVAGASVKGNDCCLLVDPRTLQTMADELEHYRLKIAELQEENAALREAARTFGDLAERLNMELKEERRRNKERRTQTRNTPDRRQLSFHSSK